MHDRIDGVPVIDLSAPGADLAYVEAKRRVGFVSVINHGVDADLIREAHDVSRRVFSLPDDVLGKYLHANFPATAGRCGYFPYGSEKAKDHMGGWDLKRFWHLYRKGHSLPNIVPEEVPEFGRTMERLFASLDRLAFRLLSALDRHSGHAPVVPFAEGARGGDTLMRVLDYPVYKDPPPDSLRSTPHEDINLITLLVAATKPGLQILTKDGRWVPVSNPPDAIVVNTGDMLQMATFGDFPSMTHRVVNPRDNDDGGRISIPFFVHPRPDVPLMTAGRYRERCAAQGDESISPLVTKQLEDLGLERRRYGADDVPLCTAGEYLRLRLKEIGLA